MPNARHSPGSLSEELDRVRPGGGRALDAPAAVARKPAGANHAPFGAATPSDEYLVDRLIELAEALLGQARALGHHYEELSKLLSDARADDPHASADGAADTPESDSPHPPGSEPPPERSSQSSGTGTGVADDEGTRLLILNMALNGAPREEAAQYLRETFAVVNDEILDEVYEKIGTQPRDRGRPSLTPTEPPGT